MLEGYLDWIRVIFLNIFRKEITIREPFSGPNQGQWSCKAAMRPAANKMLFYPGPNGGYSTMTTSPGFSQSEQMCPIQQQSIFTCHSVYISFSHKSYNTPKAQTGRADSLFIIHFYFTKVRLGSTKISCQIMLCFSTLKHRCVKKLKC